MKFLVGLVTLVAFCAGGAVPHVSRDNNHVNVQTFHLRLPDAHGVSQVVDLKKSAAESTESWIARYLPKNVHLKVTGNGNKVDIDLYIHDKPALD